MQLILPVIVMLVFGSSAHTQSGRRVTASKTPVPPQPRRIIEQQPKTVLRDEVLHVTAKGNQDYRCVLDGGVERIIEPEDVERIVSTKEIDSRAEMKARHRPTYTKEARRLGIQGFVTLRVLLSANGKVARVRVMKGLPAGLTENAIRAACRIEFKPAMKASQPVDQWVTVEYVFRLRDSSIFGP